MNFFKNRFLRSRMLPGLFLLAVLLPLAAHAQFGGGYGGGGFGGGGRRGGGFGGGGGGRAYIIRDEDDLKMIEEMEKSLDPAFKDDVFSVTRLMYEPNGYGRSRYWDDDTPDADLNLGFRMYQATSMKMHPGYNYVHITPEELAKCPFVYLAAPEGMNLSETEVKTLRAYLLNGGFLMAEDFWGDDAWSVVYQQFKRIFPDREPVELPLSHPIFHCVFDFKYKAQMPSVNTWTRDGMRYDYADYAVDHDPHYYAINDDKGRMMCIICRNNHYGDGWEHEGDDHSYFDVFSMPMAYPMFINITYYAMTH
jgi:hypothetical protein